MPELPEVETMRRGIQGTIGLQIEGVQFVRSRLKPICIEPQRATFRRRLLRQRVTAVDRIGKRLALRFESGQTLVVEPRMTGLVLLADPPDVGHLRIGLRLSGPRHTCLWYWDRRGLGSVRLLNAAQLAERFGPEKIGPDALEVTAQQLRLRLGNSRREIKVALLDQRTLAGIGNLYAAEILHAARVHPRRCCNRLTRPQWQRFHTSSQHVLRAAIQYEGSTLVDGTYRNALNQNGSYQNHHRVYNRHGQPCLGCHKTTIRRIVQAQRSTFFCPTCQPPP